MLKLKCDDLLSSFAFKFNLRRYSMGAMRDRGVTHHEQLFYDAGRRRLRQEEYEAGSSTFGNTSGP